MRGPELIVTEGIFDQLLAEQAGFNCIATIVGKVLNNQKIFGFLFPNANDGHDLGIIRSHFNDWMNEKWKSNTGGLYVFNILKEKGIVPNRCQKRIDEKIVDLVYLENFFHPEKLDHIGEKDEDPFG